MKSYPRQSSRKVNKLFSGGFFATLAVVILIGVFHFFFPSTLSGILQRGTQPLWESKNTLVVGTENALMLLSSKRSLVLENRGLKEEIEMMKLDALKLEVLAYENRSIKDLLGRSIVDETVLAVVLAHPNVSLYDTLIIDVGKDNTIQEGNLVLARGDVVIGKIETVYERTALVRLFSAPGVTSRVRIGESNTLVTAIGEGGGTFKAELPRDIPVTEGDIVTLPDISPTVFAFVETVIASSADPFQLVLFKNPININELRWVQVLLRDSLPSVTIEKEEKEKAEEAAEEEKEVTES